MISLDHHHQSPAPSRDTTANSHSRAAFVFALTLRFHDAPLFCCPCAPHLFAHADKTQVRAVMSRQPHAGARTKAEAGRSMSAAHHERMKGFTLPDEAVTVAPCPNDTAHCARCWENSMCQHPYCGTCKYCPPKEASGGGPGPRLGGGREILDYQCMCTGCARRMARCAGCGKRFVGRAPGAAGPGDDSCDDDGGLCLLPEGPDDDEQGGLAAPPQPWGDRMAAAIALAQQFSGFSQFHASYPPLFEKLWDEQDPGHTGGITTAQAEHFALRMVESGWKDWATTDRERALWAAIQAKHGFISLEHFAEASENQDFSP
jgi:hypothetical protein